MNSKHEAEHAVAMRLVCAGGVLHAVPVASLTADPIDAAVVRQALLDLDRAADDIASLRGGLS
jgi:hypothetical protein